jgi:transcriptional regulator with XRE-family HTH domain
MDAAALISQARRRAGLSLRALAELADTSHATLSAYEQRRKVPTVTTLDRILRGAGAEATVVLTSRVGAVDRADRGRELLDALELAELFPVRHDPALRAPRFGPPTDVP